MINPDALMFFLYDVFYVGAAVMGGLLFTIGLVLIFIRSLARIRDLAP
jgi:hypothetical protein